MTTLSTVLAQSITQIVTAVQDDIRQIREDTACIRAAITHHRADDLGTDGVPTSTAVQE